MQFYIVWYTDLISKQRMIDSFWLNNDEAILRKDVLDKMETINNVFLEYKDIPTGRTNMQLDPTNFFSALLWD